MNCKETRRWLLELRSSAPLPEDVRDHLRHCKACRQRRRRLLRLDEALCSLPAPEDRPEARARLLAQIRAQQPRLTLPPMRNPWLARLRGSWRLLLTAAASLLMGLSLGWYLARSGADLSKLNREPHLLVADPVVLAGREELLERMIERDLKLARTTEPGEQFELLAEMVADLRRDALRLARSGAVEQVPQVAALYEHALLRGLLGRARLVPELRRQTLFGPVLTQLHETTVEVDQLANQSLPALAETLVPLRRASQEAAQYLQAEPRSALLPGTLGPRASLPGPEAGLLVVLVTQGVRLAEETDPLSRADCCSEVAHHLGQEMVICSARGETTRAASLSRSINDYMDQAVRANLARVSMDSADDPRRARVEQVVTRASKVIRSLDRNVDGPPVPGRQDLRQALQGAEGRRVQDVRKVLADLEKRLVEHASKNKGPRKSKEIPFLMNKYKGKGKWDHLRDRDREDKKGDRKGSSRDKKSSRD